MKIVYILLLLAISLSGCSGNEMQFEGITSHEDAPSVLKAQISVKNNSGFLNVVYQPGVVWPALSVPVIIEKQIDGYDVVRSDNKTRLKLVPIATGSKQYSCTECVSLGNESRLPFMWILR